MAKGQDIVALARAALDGKREEVFRVCRHIAANEPSTSSLKESISRMLSRIPSQVLSIDGLPMELKGLVLPIQPDLTLADTAIPDDVANELASFLKDQAHAESIRAAGLATPHKVLLCGPPGNGKTTLAGAMAHSLGLPLYAIDFSAVVSSHMGETSAKIAKVFRNVASQPAVLFIDEMETLLSERSGRNGRSDVGEMARVVSTVLLEIDRLPDHVILVGATNHEEMLDRAVVRRFDYCWSLPVPTGAMVAAWLQRFARRYPDIPVLTEMPAIRADGRSLSDIERDAKKWCRRWIVESHQAISQAMA